MIYVNMLIGHQESRKTARCEVQQVKKSLSLQLSSQEGKREHLIDIQEGEIQATVDANAHRISWNTLK